MTGNRDRYVIGIDELPGSESSSTFLGHAHGAQVSFFLSHNKPGTAPGAPHKFVSRGATHRQISIHPVARMETEWLE
jgi:hypothetical protein